MCCISQHALKLSVHSVHSSFLPKSYSSTYKYPWARVLCYRGGQGKGGKEQLQEVVRYPNEIVQSSSNHYCGLPYPSLILPFSRIHVKLGGCSTRPGKVLNILSLPADYPLCLAFTHTLSRHVCNMHKNAELSPDSVLQCSKALSVCLEGLVRFLSRLDCPLPLKETVLHLFSEVLWTLRAVAPAGFSPYSLPSDFLQSMRQELMKLFSNESSSFPSEKSKMKSSVFPPAGSIGEGSSGKFSTYFQAVLELVLAAMEYQHVFHGEEFPLPPPTFAVPMSAATPTAAATPPAAAEQSKKFTRRTRTRKGAKKDAETDPQKKEEWFHVVRSAAALLRSVALQPSEQFWSQIQESSVASSLPAKPNSRLLVVTCINSKLSIESVQKAIRKVCHLYGGLYKDQLYLPVEEVKAGEGTGGELEGASGNGEGASGDGEGNVRALEESRGKPEEKEGIQDQQTEQQQPQQVSNEGSLEKPEEEQQTQQAPSKQDPPEAGAESAEEPPTTHRLVGHAVLELCCSSQVSAVSSALQSTPELQSEEGSVPVSAVSDSLLCGEDEVASKVLVEYLRNKLVGEEGLSARAERTLTDIFLSSSDSQSERRVIPAQQVTGRLQLFLSGYVGGKGSVQEVVEGMCEQQKGLTLERFLHWALEQVDGGVAALWQGLFSSGYDLHFVR